MGENTDIEWCDHSFNPWHGCQRVSPGCENCYAEALSKRYGNNVWGPAKTTQRKPMSEPYWKGPVKWDRDAAREGRRHRVFCASMADVFEDHPQLPPMRARLFDLIEATPNLDWLLLTKRPENVLGMAPASWLPGFPRNVWMGTSVEDQRRADERIPHLLRIPAAIRFLSAEPLLGPVDLSLALGWRSACGVLSPDPDVRKNGALRRSGLHWCIIGGESGPGARPMDLSWARDLVAQCAGAGVAPFVKQLGSRPVDTWADTGALVLGREPRAMRLRDHKGGDIAEFPDDLHVREWPVVLRMEERYAVRRAGAGVQ